MTRGFVRHAAVHSNSTPSEAPRPFCSHWFQARCSLRSLLPLGAVRPATALFGGRCCVIDHYTAMTAYQTALSNRRGRSRRQPSCLQLNACLSTNFCLEHINSIDLEEI